MSSTAVVSIDPTSGADVEIVTEATSAEALAEICDASASAFTGLQRLGRPLRVSMLRAMAAELEAGRNDIVTMGVRETGLPRTRLEGELTRTVYQARLFADVVEEGGYLEATIDHAGETPMGPGPDLRRMLVPTGPVAVFGASNFPLAFSVPGGDTISALAAGCPVVVKAHDSHPALSKLTFEALARAAAEAGAPDGTLGIVFGREAGSLLAQHPAITAVGFTGSLTGGRALMRLIERRETPIPFYGELASINPIVVTPAAAAARGEELAQGLVTSITGSAGQLCTKPGLVLVPHGDSGDALVAAAVALVDDAPAATLLNERIRDSYLEITAELGRTKGVQVLSEGHRPTDHGFAVTPRLLGVDAADLVGQEVGECFGPTTIIVRYTDTTRAAALATLPGSLTATIHSEPEDDIDELVATLLPKTGRLLFDGFPTGVLVSWAQHHGGPWPATNTQHTSVGPTAIRRFLRPLTWQAAPERVLPDELRDGFTQVPRRVDGHLVPAVVGDR